MADQKITITLDAKTMKLVKQLAKMDNKTVEELVSKIVKIDIRRTFFLRDLLESYKEEGLL